MSEKNVELHRRVLEAANARDVEANIALADPSFEYHSVFGVGAIYHGHEGVRRWHRDMEEAWGDEFRIEPEAFFDLGEHTLAWQVLHGRGRQSGADVALPTAAVMRWRDALAVYAKVYTQREDALRELDVSEDELEPIAP